MKISNKKLYSRFFSFLYDQKISAKVLTGTMIAFIFAATIGIIAFYQLQQVNLTINRLTGELTQQRDYAEEILRQIHSIRFFANQYIYDGQKPSDLEEYNNAVNGAQILLTQADQFITDQDQALMQMQVRDDFNSFTSSFAEIVQILATNQATVNDTLEPQGAKCVDDLAKLRDTSFETLDFVSAHYASQARDTFSQMQANVIHYLASGDEQVARQVELDYQTITSAFDLLKTSIGDGTSHQLLENIQSSAAAYYQGFQIIHSGISHLNELIHTHLNSIGLRIDSQSAMIVSEINIDYKNRSLAMSSRVYQIQQVTIILIIFLVFAGLIFSLFLGQTITRPIEQIAQASLSIAKGSYEQEIFIDRKDELGILAESFNFMTRRVRETMTALRESKERYLTLFETANDAIFVLEGETFLDCNQQAIRMFGFENKSVIIGRTPMDFFITEQSDGEYTGEKLQTFIKNASNGDPQFFEWKLFLKDLPVLYAEVSLNRFILNDKVFLQAIIRNITDRKRAEEGLELFKKSIDIAPDGAYWMDLNGHFVYVNEAGSKSLGYSPDELLQKTIFDINPHANSKLWLQTVNGLKEKQFYAVQTVHRRKDNTEYPVEIVSTYIKSNDQEYINGFARDITERRRAEAAIFESENRYRTLAEASFEGIVITENGKIVDTNQQLLDMLGYSSSEVSGKPLISFIIPEDRPRDENVMAEGGEHIGEYRAQKGDGSIVIVETHGRDFEINQRQLRITSIRDITEQRQNEEELRRDAERSRSLSQISARLNASLDLQEVLDAVCEEIALLLQVPVTLISFVDEDFKNFSVQAAFGLSPSIIQQIQPFPNEIYPSAQKKLGNIFYYADVEQVNNSNSQIIRRLGLHTNLSCKLYHNNQLIGNLNVFRRELGWNFNDADLTLLQILCNQIGIAIHNAQLFDEVKNGHARLQAMSEKLVNIQEAERRHLAIELHDEIGQSLTHIKLNLDRYCHDHPETSDLESAREIIKDLMNRVRSLSLELRPSILDDLGLLPALLWHIERFTTQTSIKVDFRPSGVDRRFSPQVESTVYRILQESMTNIARHSSATEVTIILWSDNKRLGLQVEDNGIGFDRAANQQKITGGLSGMQERAQICGGQLVIDSQVGKGTYISLDLPLEAEFLEWRKR